MFSLLIRRDGMLEPPALGELDGHCHILPGLDDGAPDDATAFAIARLLVEMGVRTVVATPHVISDAYPNSREQILAATARLAALLTAERIPLTVIPGAEYYAEPQLLTLIDQGALLSWGTPRYVMFEAPSEQETPLVEAIVFHLKAAGFQPLLAHVERYRWLQRDASRVRDLKRLGVAFQVNHPSFHLPKTSHRGELARALLLKGYIDVYGTDMHRAAGVGAGARGELSALPG